MNNSITPWDIPVEKRIEEFHSSNSLLQKKRILFLYDTPDGSTFRYRGYNLAQHLNVSKQWSLHYFFTHTELNYAFDLVSSCDVLVLCRTQWTYKLDLLINKARAFHIPVLYDIDDLIFDLQYIPLLTNTVGSPTDTLFKQENNYQSWFSLVGRIHLCASRADGFITTNEFLGEKLSNVFQKPYKIIHNTLNHEQLAISEEIAKEKQERNDFVIGYFSGSPTHMNDFSIIAQEIQFFLEAHRNAKLFIVGYMKLPAYLQHLVDRGQIESHSLVDFITLQKLIASVDVNIVPLIDNDFNNSKSELKYFEAAVVDTLTIASPTYAYRTAITHEKNGFLCHPGTWFDTLENIYYNRCNRTQIILTARKHVFETYSGSKILTEIESCYNYFYEEHNRKRNSAQQYGW